MSDKQPDTKPEPEPKAKKQFYKKNITDKKDKVKKVKKINMSEIMGSILGGDDNAVDADVDF